MEDQTPPARDWDSEFTAIVYNMARRIVYCSPVDEPAIRRFLDLYGGREAYEVRPDPTLLPGDTLQVDEQAVLAERREEWQHRRARRRWWWT